MVVYQLNMKINYLYLKTFKVIVIRCVSLSELQLLYWTFINWDKPVGPLNSAVMSPHNIRGLRN